MMTDDMELLREYVQHGSEEAFATLVSRHINLVYTAALRQLHDPHLAEEVTQAAFIILARKGSSLNSKTILSAWLYRTAQYAASDALKIQRRRQRREHEAHLESVVNDPEPESSNWTDIAPLLDAAMAQLGEKDHSAIVLRFFEGKDLREVGATLGVSENAAKTRVSRATDKLRQFFAKRGITMSAAALGQAVALHSVQAAPTGLAASVTAVTVKGTAVTSTTLTVIKTTLKIMAWSKLKCAAIAGVIAIVAATAITAIRHRVKAPAQSSAFVFAGYTDPESAIDSLFWALGTGDIEKVLSSCTPEQAARMRKRTEGKSKDEIKADLIKFSNQMVGYELNQKQVMSDTEVRLLLRVPPSAAHPKVGNDLQVVQKVGNDWKYAGKFGVDIKETAQAGQ